MRWILLFFRPPVARAQLSVEQILQKVKDFYAGAQQLQLASHVVERRHGIETSGSREIVVDRRGRLWFKAEGSLAAAESGGAEGTRLIVVADGRAIWVYLGIQTSGGCANAQELCFG